MYMLGIDLRNRRKATNICDFRYECLFFHEAESIVGHLFDIDPIVYICPLLFVLICFCFLSLVLRVGLYILFCFFCFYLNIFILSVPYFKFQSYALTMMRILSIRNRSLRTVLISSYYCFFLLVWSFRTVILWFPLAGALIFTWISASRAHM